MAIWTLTDPWFRKLIEYSKWPRLVSTSGVCLVCSGLLFIWFAVAIGSRTAPWFVVAGLLTGMGASILLSQNEIIIAQYFKVRLMQVNVFLQAATVVGFVLTPTIMGDHIIKIGFLKVILWYQAIILQGVIVSMLIKKPPYLKAQGNPYKLIHQASQDDEVDIFAKNSTELQNARHSLPSEDTPSTSTVIATIESESNHIENQSKSSRKSWVTFDDEQENAKPKTKSTLQNSFKNIDIERIETVDEGFPTPLFTETHLNNNTSYSFDVGESTLTNEPTVFVPNAQPKPSLFDTKYSFLLQPTFYKSLLQTISLKFSIFMFYALFPTFMYNRIERLPFHLATHLVGSVNTAALVFVVINLFVSPTHKMKAFFLWLSSWIGALGYVLLTDVHSETWFVIGAMLIILSMQSLQHFGQPLLNITRKGESTKIHLWLSTFTAIAFMIFFVIDFSYVNCFRLMALIQFIMGGIWFANFLFKQIKPMFLNRS
ncbi:uncharacterized protein [Onthophagus taurus]